MKFKITRSLKRGWSRAEGDNVKFTLYKETLKGGGELDYFTHLGEFVTYEEAETFAKEYKANFNEVVVDI